MTMTLVQITLPMKLLLVGIGGVGCEFLVLLDELLRINGSSFDSEMLEIVVIDDDLVEESNLNRQRLYSKQDIGKAKVEAARRVLSSMKLTPLKIKVEKINDTKFFEQFDAFILAVDNLETRRWINSTVLQTCKKNQWFLMDLGVQGFKLSIRTVKPQSACLECTLPLYLQDEEDEIPVCSLYGQPRDLKDCVYWSLQQETLSTVSVDDLKNIYSLTKDRAEKFSIATSELSFSFIKTLITRTIPAVASVNSLLAAKGLELFINRQFKNNFWMINMENGYYELSTLLEIDENCLICKQEK